MDEARERDVFTTLQHFRRQPILLLVFLSLITLTLYFPFWFFRQGRSIRATPGARPLPRFLASAYLVVSFASMAWAVPEVLSNDARWALQTGQLLNWVNLGVYLVLLFELRQRLHEIANARRGEPSWFSGFLTWLLGPFYVQYRLNRLIP